MPDHRRLSAAPDASGGSAPAPAPVDQAVSRAVPLPAVPKLMAGKRGLVMGVANDRSIAWGIAQALHAAGIEVVGQAGDFRAQAIQTFENLKHALDRYRPGLAPD